MTLINKIRKSIIFENFTALMAMKFLTYIFPIIITPYLYRVLGLETYGLIAFAISIGIYLNIIHDFGIEMSGTQKIASSPDQKTRNDIINSFLFIKVLLFVLSFVIFSLLVFFIGRLWEHRELYFIIWFSSFGWALYPVWFFQGIEKMKIITMINVSVKFVLNLFVFILIKDEGDYLKYPLLLASGNIISALWGICIMIIRYKVRIYLPDISVLKSSLAYSFSFFYSRLATSFYTNSNTFILGIVGGNAFAGLYDIAVKIYSGIQNLYGALIQAIYPYMCRTRNTFLLKRITLIVTVLNLLLVLILIIYSQTVMELLFDNVQEESIQTFKYLLICLAITVPSIMLGYPYLAALGYHKFTNNTIVITSLYHIIGIILLYTLHLINPINIALLLISTESILLLFRVWKVFMIKNTVNATKS